MVMDQYDMSHSNYNFRTDLSIYMNHNIVDLLTNFFRENNIQPEHDGNGIARLQEQIESIRNSFHILDFRIITGITIRYIPNFNRSVYYIHIYRGNDYYYSSENENELIDSIDTDNAYINNIP